MTSATDILKIIAGKRWRLVVALFALEVAAIIIVSNSPFFPGELSTFQKQYNDIKPVLSQDPTGQVASIFANNFRVAMAELIPGFGPLLFAFSIYETARIVEVIGLTGPAGVGGALATLFILPSTWLELPAYAIAVTESIYFLRSLYVGATVNWGRFGQEVVVLFVNIFLIAGVLIVAATIEVTEIQLESGPEPALALLTWIPALAVMTLVIKFWRRARRDAPSLDETGGATPTAMAPTDVPVVIKPGVVRYCPNCGKLYAGSPAFCSACGAPLPP